jgi:hypothetical protein
VIDLSKHMNVKTLIQRVIGGAMLLSTALFSQPAQAEVIQGEAVAVSLKGKAEYSLDGATWNELTRNTVLKPGAVVRTDKDSFVDLFMNYNGPAVRIEASSRLRLTKLDREEKGDTIVTDTVLTLAEGSIVGYAQKATSGSRYIVETPRGVANITGTTYSVNAFGYVIVTSGAVEVRYSPVTGAPLSAPLVVGAGQMYDPTTGTVVTAGPPGTSNLLATVNTLMGNVRRFNLARGATVEVKAISN